MKSKKERTSVSTIAVGMEITPSSIYTVICSSCDGVQQLKMLETRWQESSASLRSDEGERELTAALKRLVEDHNLRSQKVHLSIDGEFCISRFRSGVAEDVQSRLEGFEHHSQRYLLLGAGPKIGRIQVKDVADGKSEGQLTIANLRTLHTISRAFDANDIQLASIGSSAIVLAGMIDQIFDGNGSGLMVRARESGADISVIDAGRQILEIRPAGNIAASQLHEFVAGRFALMERYFLQHRVISTEGLSRLFVFGDRSTFTPVMTEFSCRGLLVEEMNARLGLLPWFESQDSPCQPDRFAAALGSIFGHVENTQQIQRPDLLEELRELQPAPVRFPILTTFWPLAASLILCAAISALSAIERTRATSLEASVHSFRSLLMRTMTVEDEQSAVETEVSYISAVRDELNEPGWDKLVQQLATCLANDAWLEGFEIENGDRIRLLGTSSNETQVYDFVQAMRQLDNVRKAAISGTQPLISDGVARVSFIVEAELQRHTTVAFEESARVQQ